MNKMRFDYQVYFRQNCVVPTILVLFCLIIIICIIYSIASEFSYESFKSFFNKNIKSFIFLIILFFLISTSVPHLARGGWYLFFEKESDFVELEGRVEDTFELSWYGGSKYDIEQNNGNGEGLVIDECKYYLITYGKLKKGDYVTIKVLPKSKYILEIIPISE